jgi:ribosomal protein L24E
MARSVIASVINNTRSKIASGTAVYQTGFDSDLGRIRVAPASYESLNTMPAIGIVQEDIEPGGEGIVKKTGLIGNIDTSSVSPNTPVFVGSGGALTFTDPNDTNFDFYSQQLGTVTRTGLSDQGLVDLFPLEVRPKIKHDEILEVREEQHHDPVTAKNIGGGATVFKQIDVQNMTFKTLVAGTKMRVNNFADRIEIADKNLVDWIGPAEAGQLAFWVDGDTITGQSELYWDADNGELRVENVLALKEAGTPSSTNNFGKLFVKSTDSRLYFLDEDGTEFDLLAAGTGVPDTTFQQNKTFWNEAIYHLTIAADAYSASAGSVVPELTFQQNKSFWNEAIYHLRVAADGYAAGSSLSATQGADGYIAFFTGSNTLAGDNDLFFNRVTNALGIGGNPDSTIKLFVRQDGGTQTSLKLEHGGSNFIVRPVSAGSTSTIIENTGGGSLIINPSGGTIGIGTSSPAAKLEIETSQPNGGLGGASILLENTDATGSGDSGVILRNPVADWFMGVDRSDSSKLRLTTDDEPEFSSLGITIATTGEVGIGTKTPDNTLHVHKGSAGTVTANSSAALVVEHSGSTYMHMLTPDAAESGLIFGTPDVSVGGAIVYNSSLTRGGYQFRAQPNITRMVISSNGNVGIGTFTPHATLTVNGHIALEETAVSPPAQDGYGYLYVKTDDKLYYRSGPGTEFDLTSAASGVTATQGADGYVAFFTGTNTIAGDNDLFFNRANHNLTLMGGGNIGIGITNPTSRLHVQNDAGNDRPLAITDPDSSIEVNLFITDDISAFGTRTNHQFRLMAGDITGITLNRMVNQGNNEFTHVGIGTLHPHEVLTVAGPISLQETSAPSQNFDGYGALYVKTDNKLYFKDDTGTEFDLTTGGGVSTSGISADGYLAFFVNSTTIAGDNDLFYDRINSRLGIGTSSPLFDINVYSEADAGTGILIRNDGSGPNSFAFSQWQGSGEFGQIVQFRGGNNASFFDTPVANSFVIIGRGTNSKMMIGAESAIPLILGTANVPRIIIDYNGNVGIGTRNPIELLTVNGVIALQELTANPVTEDGYGKVYVRDDNKLYYKDGLGNIFDLTADNTGLSETTFQENKTAWDEAIYHLTVAADGYVINQTFEENKNAQEEINRQILISLDGYGTGTGTGSGTVTSAEGSDGYVAFFTGPDALSGDNDLFWNRERNQLGIGTSAPNEKLTVSGAISIEERADDPEEEAGFGKLWVRTDGKLFFIKEDGVQYDLTAFTGDVDGGNFADILNTIPAVDGGDF